MDKKNEAPGSPRSNELSTVKVERKNDIGKLWEGCLHLQVFPNEITYHLRLKVTNVNWGSQASLKECKDGIIRLMSKNMEGEE